MNPATGWMLASDGVLVAENAVILQPSDVMKIIKDYNGLHSK